jgi:hypothetical protein
MNVTTRGTESESTKRFDKTDAGGKMGNAAAACADRRSAETADSRQQDRRRAANATVIS